MGTPRFLSSTCTIGSPFTKIVTSYRFLHVPVCSNWLITCSLLRAGLRLSTRWMFCSLPSSKVKSHTGWSCTLRVLSVMESPGQSRYSLHSRCHSASVKCTSLSVSSCRRTLSRKASGVRRSGRYS